MCFGGIVLIVGACCDAVCINYELTKAKQNAPRPRVGLVGLAGPVSRFNFLFAFQRLFPFEVMWLLHTIQILKFALNSANFSQTL